MAIETFSIPETRWLSNMYRLEEWVTTEQGIDVPRTENAYQANKFADPAVHRLVAETEHGLECKELAQQLTLDGAKLIDGWSERKIQIMYDVNWQKFTRNMHLTRMLIETGTEELVEGNYWGDRFWGVDPIGSRNGRNELGKVLMRVRAVLVSDFPGDT